MLALALAALEAHAQADGSVPVAQPTRAGALDMIGDALDAAREGRAAPRGESSRDLRRRQDAAAETERLRDAVSWSAELVGFGLRIAEVHVAEGRTRQTVETRERLASAYQDPVRQEDGLPPDNEMLGHDVVFVDGVAWIRGTLPNSPERFPAESVYARMGEYDVGVVRPIFRDQRLLPDFTPAGKTICDVRIFPRDIFVPEEPFPTVFNALHATTRESTIRTALGIEAGQIYDDATLLDAIESLRGTQIYSTIQVLPTLSTEPDCVDLAIITRDIWSLRVGWDLELSGGTLSALDLQLVETNLLGLNDTLGVTYSLSLGSWELGPTWAADWVADHNLELAIDLRAIFDRASGDLDGSSQQFLARRPIRRESDTFGWHVDLQQRTATERTFDGDQLRTETYTASDGALFEIPRQWRESRTDAEGGYTRAFGTGLNHDLTAGAFMDLRIIEARPGQPDVPEEVLTRFEDERLSPAQRGLGLLFRYEIYERRYLDLLNYQDLARTERYRGGFEARLDLKWSEPGFGADRRYLDLLAIAAYRAGIGSDGFAEVAALQAARVGLHVADMRTEGSLRLGLPSGFAGRFVSRTFVRRLVRNRQNEFFELRDTNAVRGLRGPVREGDNVLMQNIEWRSKPVDLLSIRVGLAFFTDIGATWAAGDPLEPAGSFGLGLRLFAPQFMSGVVSIDLGFGVTDLDALRLGGWEAPFARPSVGIRFGQLFGSATSFSAESLEF